MTYQEFLKIYLAAGDHDEKEMFIADNGGMWIEGYPDEKIVDLLSAIWDVAKGGFNALRSITGLSQRAFSDKYFIAKRTIENWSLGAKSPEARSAPSYVLTLLAYAVLKDEIII